MFKFTKIKRSLGKNPKGEDFSIKIAQDHREHGVLRNTDSRGT